MPGTSAAPWPGPIFDPFSLQKCPEVSLRANHFSILDFLIDIYNICHFSLLHIILMGLTLTVGSVFFMQS